jgi:hypothetical protein
MLLIPFSLIPFLEFTNFEIFPFFSFFQSDTIPNMLYLWITAPKGPAPIN